MPVAGVQRQIVLEDQGGNPHIVGRNRRPLLAELAVERRVVVSGLLVRKENRDALPHQEASQRSLVRRSLAVSGVAATPKTPLQKST